MLDLPLHILIALWLIKRLAPKQSFLVDPVVALSVKADMLQSLLNSMSTNYSRSFAQRALLDLVQGYANEMQAESMRLRDTHVGLALGFVSFSDNASLAQRTEQQPSKLEVHSSNL